MEWDDPYLYAFTEFAKKHWMYAANTFTKPQSVRNISGQSFSDLTVLM